MDIETLLQGYRVKYGLEAEQAQAADPFASGFMDTPQPTQNADWMPADELAPQGQGLTPNASLKDQQAMKDFFTMADSNPILSKKLNERDAALMEINSMLRDPTNPMDEQSAMALVDEIELHLDEDY